MTYVENPLFVVLPSLCAGLVVGYYLPSEYYLAPAFLVGAFAWWLSSKNKGMWADLMLLLLCVFIGAQRMSSQLVKEEYDRNNVSTLELRADRITDRLISRLQDAGLQGDEMSLTTALVLGRRDGIDSEMRTRFRQVGASHLLALSGMHLGVIYGLLCVICIRWVRFSPLRWVAIPVLIFGLWTYALLAGMPASLVRAASMLSLVCIGTLLFQTLPLLHTLTLSVIILLFVRPLLLLDVGFQLSCSAVLFIALAYVPIHDYFRTWPLLLRWPVRMLLLSLSAQVGTLPLSAYYFHSLPLLGPLASLLLIPVTTFLIYGGMFTLIFPIPFFASFTALCVRTELWILDAWMNLFPSALWDHIHPSLLSVVLIYVVMLAGFIRLYKLSSDMKNM